MSPQSYLIDTNILIGLEDYHKVEEAYAKFHSLAFAHKINVFVHEAAKQDILRDKDADRREIYLSKIKKYRVLKNQRGLTKANLEERYGILNKPNDVVDATLLYALEIGATDFLVSQDKGLHERAQNHSAELGRRVLFVGDAVDLLIQTYQPKEVPFRHVAEVEAHEIKYPDIFFDSFHHDYPEFNDWWINKCVKLRRRCWVVYDDDTLAGLIVIKDETATDTDAVTPAEKILKICTFKVSPEKRGIKLGELLLKKSLWYAQANDYNLAYLTTYEEQVDLMNLLEFYGFSKTDKNENGEFIYERKFDSSALKRDDNNDSFVLARTNYPRFLLDDNIQGFGIPIKERYHDTLYPDLFNPLQLDLFSGVSLAEFPTRPGNTIRKVYICHAQSNLGNPGSILFFYKSSSKDLPSQAMTAIGILESVKRAQSTEDLMLLTGGRSVYSKDELDEFGASKSSPVKVINYLLAAYIEPPISLNTLRELGVVKKRPPQSIYKIRYDLLRKLLMQSNLTFDL